MRPRTGSMTAHSWRNLGMAGHAVGSQENCFRRVPTRSWTRNNMREVAGWPVYGLWRLRSKSHLPKRTTRIGARRALPPSGVQLCHDLNVPRQSLSESGRYGLCKSATSRSSSPFSSLPRPRRLFGRSILREPHDVRSLDNFRENVTRKIHPKSVTA
jgi:hypothetical protein